MRIIPQAVLFSLPLLLLGLATVAGFHEAAPFLARLDRPEQQVAAEASFGSRAPSVSVFESRYARTARLDGCLQTLRRILGSSETPIATISALTRECLALAEAVAARSPLDSNVWFVAANLAARVNEFAKVRAFLGESYLAGASEQWIAERRAPFTYAIRDRLDADLRARMDRDFALLLRNDQGVGLLAARYAADPSIREYLIGIAEKLDPEAQRRLLKRIRIECGRQREGCALPE